MRARHEWTGGPTVPPRVDERLTARLRRELAGLDCGCRDKAEAVLDGIDADEDARARAGALADARGMRDAIVLVLALLGEVDEIAADEPDRSAFAELADLFEDAAGFAAAGAEAMRRLAGAAARRHEA